MIIPELNHAQIIHDRMMDIVIGKLPAPTATVVHLKYGMTKMLGNCQGIARAEI